MKFRSRSVANQPIVEITGYSVEHILTSRYFWTNFGGGDKVFEEDGTVFFAPTGDYELKGVIGWIFDE